MRASPSFNESSKPTMILCSASFASSVDHYPDEEKRQDLSQF